MKGLEVRSISGDSYYIYIVFKLMQSFFISAVLKSLFMCYKLALDARYHSDIPRRY